MSLTWDLRLGDVRERLRELPSGSVQTCVTSPPYWGLRDYGTAQWEGGDAACVHQGINGRTVSGGAGKQYTNAGSNRVYSGDCECGARRVDAQIGLEPTPEAYVAELVAVFAEVRRVLADDGTLWVNLGDSYAAQEGQRKVTDAAGPKQLTKRGSTGAPSRFVAELKPKDLVGIPWRVAFALQADGWYLRSDVIWHKPNPMPESVTDRPTKAHEYLFLLSKQARYYYDAEAIAEKASHSMLSQMEQGYFGEARKDYDGAGVQNPSSVKARIIAGARRRTDASKSAAVPGKTPDALSQRSNHDWTLLTRNRRSVWTVTTKPYPDAHFATYPPALIEPCILAGSRPGDTVLDPFTGSGTTGEVALRLGRHFVGCELNQAYLQLARKRLGAVAPLFATEVSA